MLSLLSETQQINSFETVQLDRERLNDSSVVDVTVDPHDEATVLLGIYEPEDAPKGFSIALNADTDTTDSVIAQVMSAERNKKHEFILYINNSGNKVLTAEARPL